MAKRARAGSTKPAKSSMGETVPERFDRKMKLAFQFPAMVEDCIRYIYCDEVSDQLDFTQLAERSLEYISDKSTKTLADCVWSVPSKSGDLMAVFVFEFQWTADANMARRCLISNALTFQKEARKQKSAAWAQPLAVIPVVVYLGPGEWNAPRTLFEAGQARVLHESVRHLQLEGPFELVELQALANRGTLRRVRSNFCAALLRLLRYSGPQAVHRGVEGLRNLARARGQEGLCVELVDLAGLVQAVLESEGKEAIISAQEGDATIAEGRAKDMNDAEKYFPYLWEEFEAYHRKEHRKSRVRGQKEILVELCRERYGKGCAGKFSKHLMRVNSLAKLSNLGRLLIKSASADDFLAQARAV